MGGQIQIFQSTKFMIFRKWLLFVNIQTGSGNLSTFQCINQSTFLDDSSTGTVENSNSILHFGECIFINHILCLFGQWHMYRQVISLPESLFQFNLHQVQFCCPVFSEIRVVGNNFHFESKCPLGNLHTDSAKPQNCQGFSPQFRTF